MRTIKLISIAATLAAVACGGSSGGGGYSTSPSTPGGTGNPAPATPNTVNVTTDLTFSPNTMDVTKGTTVTWKWAPCSDGGYGGYGSCASHSVLFDDGITSATQTEGSYSRTFDVAGTFKYHCAVHGSGMSGQVNVK